MKWDSPNRSWQSRWIPVRPGSKCTVRAHICHPCLSIDTWQIGITLFKPGYWRVCLVTAAIRFLMPPKSDYSFGWEWAGQWGRWMDIRDWGTWWEKNLLQGNKKKHTSGFVGLKIPTPKVSRDGGWWQERGRLLGWLILQNYQPVQDTQTLAWRMSGLIPLSVLRSL